MYRCVIQYAGRPWLGDGSGLAMPTGKVRHKYQAWGKGAHSSPVPAPCKDDRPPSKNATRKAKRYKGECPNMGALIGTKLAREVCRERMMKRLSDK